MRLFAAIPVSPSVKDLVARVVADLAARGWPVRWVRSDHVHLTVKFYGQVEDGHAVAVAASLEAAARGTGSIPIEVAGAGVFPSTRRARVLWLGVEAPGALELLHHRVEVAAAELGYPGEGRPFRPHLTLGRVRQGELLPSGADEALDGISERAQFLAEELVLYESRVSFAGATHHSRAAFRLDAA